MDEGMSNVGWISKLEVSAERLHCHQEYIVHYVVCRHLQALMRILESGV
jgi:hypothetical protein